MRYCGNLWAGAFGFAQEAREWLAAFDAASLELAKAQSANEDGAADEVWKAYVCVCVCVCLILSCLSCSSLAYLLQLSCSSAFQQPVHRPWRRLLSICVRSRWARPGPFFS